MQSVERLMDLYDSRAINRRELFAGLVTLGLGGQLTRPTQGAFAARALNHVSLGVSNVAKSKSFYQRLLGLPIRDEGSDYCEFKLENGFLGLYERDQGMKLGIDHFAIGVDGYVPKEALAKLQRELPESSPTIENDDQVYFHDPDGAKGQLTAVDYKR